MLTALGSSIASRGRGWSRYVAMARAMTQRSRGCMHCSSAKPAIRFDDEPLRSRTRPDRDLDDLAMQAADDALVAILGKLDRFRGDARFTTWARRFAELEVPGKIRPPARSRARDPDRNRDAGVAPGHGRGCAGNQRGGRHRGPARRADRPDLTGHQREVLVALAIDGVDFKDLATRLNSTQGAL